MNIGVDVDGVLVELESYQIEVGGKFFKKKYGYDVVNPAGFDVRDIFNCTEKERKNFWKRYIWKHIISRPARENSASVLKKLHDEGHKIYIITGRVMVTKKNFLGWLSRTILKNWFRRHRIVYDDIFYCSESNSERDKVLGCQNFDIDMMIEDKTENIMAMSEVTKVICFDAAYNRDCEGENISRARNWGEVEKIISTNI
jgi:uncharacterized HAD superfamily protein